MKLSRKLVVGIILLTLCMASLPLTALVSADVQGIGKFLTINFVGEGSVTAVKTSGEWTYSWNGIQTYKLGAGTVDLTAVPAEGWVFLSWSGGLTGNPVSVKTEKYQTITVTFVKKFVITASAGPNGGINPSGSIAVDYGATQTFTFTPASGYHVSAILVDGQYVALGGEGETAGFTFNNVVAKHSITVSFSLVGQADVPNVDGVSVFLDSGVSLNYIDVTSSGTASGEEITGFPAGMFILLWDISNTAGFDGGVTVAFAYGDDLTPAQEDALRLIRVELLVDVNLDGKVDGTDVSMVANANPSEPGSANWNPFLDVNHDGKIDDADVNLVNDHIGETSGLEDITVWVDTANNIIYGSTDHFSVFGVR